MPRNPEDNIGRSRGGDQSQSDAPAGAGNGGSNLVAPNLPSCGDFDMRIARDGTWFYRGSPIGRQALAKLFSTVLRREADGSYWLVTPAERGRILVDDAPFTAVALDRDGEGPAQALTFRTNLDEAVTADADHPIRVAHDGETGEPSPYIMVRDGLEARLVRAVYYQLVDYGEERRDESGATYGVWSKGQFFPLGTLEDG